MNQNLSLRGFVIAFVLGLVAAYAVLRESPERARVHAQPREASAAAGLTAGEEQTIALFEEASPSTVFITSITQRRDFFSLDVTNVPAGTGSGFVWDTEGHVITNFHVIQQANAAEVTLADHSTWPADLVGIEPDKDLAVLKIAAPAELLKPLRIGTSAGLRVGQNVYAIGNPFGLDQTLTTGVISGLGREIQSVTGRPIQGAIQTDASINPGNSGGPLLDSAGRLIGVNTAIYSSSGASSGVGFAVPVDTIARLIPQLIQFGHSRRAAIGVAFAPDHVARQLRVPGLIVATVGAGTPAEAAGLHAAFMDPRGRVVLGDVITKIDSAPVKNSDDLFRIMDRHEPGDTVTLELLREGQSVSVSITLAVTENQ